MKEEKNKITKKKMMNVYTLVNVISIGMNTEKWLNIILKEKKKYVFY